MITINIIKTHKAASSNKSIPYLPITQITTGNTPARIIPDKSSEAAQFFGVDSRQNILQKLENHIKLVLLKSKESGILASFPRRAYFSVDNQNTIENAWNYIWTKAKGRKFDTLLTNPARMTFNGKFFGNDSSEDSHTIGILFDTKTKTLFCLDSLSNLCKQVHIYQEILKTHLFNAPNNEIKRIIFSNKNQQNMNEYTCNNWAIANIEALRKALGEGKDIDSPEKLNEILPNDINAILQDQYEYVIKHNITPLP